ncbi:MAG: DUF4468 domain-containing protein [Candidatus Cloacimonetes bacterium]|nr:DUF4468 domain-containing protein [Candidatus Cloacimonadota bacterium]MDY0367547.1 DUF4468 domain-containing protein [Candidatus Syntrophosphaera sp.]
MRYNILFPTLIAIIIALSVSGCANVTTRYGFDPGEGVYTYTNAVTKEQAAAYYLAEEWLSLNIDDANKVINLRQPETGTLVAKPSILVSVAYVPYWASYTLKIGCKDNQVITTFTMGTLENGTYPPRDAMPSLEARFASLAASLHEYIETN